MPPTKRKKPPTIPIRYRDIFDEPPPEAEVWIGLKAASAEVTLEKGLVCLLLRGIAFANEPMMMQGSMKRVESKRKRRSKVR
jgi:hypothetical protein